MARDSYTNLRHSILCDLDTFEALPVEYQALVEEISLDIWGDLENESIVAILRGEMPMRVIEFLVDRSRKQMELFAA